MTCIKTHTNWEQLFHSKVLNLFGHQLHSIHFRVGYHARNKAQYQLKPILKIWDSFESSGKINNGSNNDNNNNDNSDPIESKTTEDEDKDNSVINKIINQINMVSTFIE